MNLQEEPFQAISEALSGILLNNVYAQDLAMLGTIASLNPIKNAQIGWPDPKFLSVDGNLPAVFFVQVSEIAKNIVSRHKVHKTTVNPDGSGYVFREQMRLFFMFQMSIFTNSAEDRAAIGWAIKQYLITNYRLALADGEYAMFELKGDHQSFKPDSKYYQRDLTWMAQARVLDATPAVQVKQIVPVYNIK